MAAETNPTESAPGEAAKDDLDAWVSEARPSGAAGRVDLRLRFYLPEEFGTRVSYAAGWGRWQEAARLEGRPGWWEARLEGLRPNRELRFRYRDFAGRWQALAPVGGCENLNGRFAVPKIGHDWKAASPRTNRAKVLLEATLEGLIGGYGDGIQAPSELQDQLTATVSRRLLRCRAVDRLAKLEIDEIMAPVGPAVADRARLNPKFNYLTYAVGDVDWQIGTPADLQALVDALYARGVRLVPDLIFAHFVKNPHAAALDNIVGRNGRRLYADGDPYLFRDYGTWMYDFGNPEVRRILCARLADFVRTYHLDVVRFDYVDGIMLQYSRRKENLGEVFLRELKAALREAKPDLIIIGEAFSTGGAPAVQEAIEVVYCPRGFVVAEELYRPPSQLERPRYPDLRPILAQAAGAGGTDRREAVYAQLHDEAWWDPHIRMGRPDTPWAYGAQPAELARRCGLELVEARLLQHRGLLEFVRRRVRLVEAFTMFLSNLRYMYLPGVDSLALGRLDEEGRWRVEWDDPAPQDVVYWRSTGLDATEIHRLHDQHRRDMLRLRRLYRETSEVEEYGQWPLTRVAVQHANVDGCVISLLRRHVRDPARASIVVFNFGPNTYHYSTEYQLPVPEDLAGEWAVAFDGDRMDADLLVKGGLSSGYAPGHRLRSEAGNKLVLELGAQSLLVLRPMAT